MNAIWLMTDYLPSEKKLFLSEAVVVDLRGSLEFLIMPLSS